MLISRKTAVAKATTNRNPVRKAHIYINRYKYKINLSKKSIKLRFKNIQKHGYVMAFTKIIFYMVVFQQQNCAFRFWFTKSRLKKRFSQHATSHIVTNNQI